MGTTLNQHGLPLSLKLNNDKGQTMVEYALLLLFIAIIVAVSLPAVATALTSSFEYIAAAFPG